MEDDRLIGTLVADRYRVTRKLGEGGMGLVYLAVHEALRKPVALKVLSTTGRTDREALARFEREAIAAANLKHPNIAEAADFGQLPDGGLYIVMEHVEGTTLRRFLAEQGKLAPERALAILHQIASALAMAHARDVVHRDLKPENVIVTRPPESSGQPNELVKVIDFGIAKLRSTTFGAGGTGLTSAGTVFGTPTYMSPEQVMGQVVDSRSDQYALGVLAFELLTGKPPYQCEDVGQLMMMHVGAPVPSTRDMSPALPPEVDGVTAKMLAKLPDERFTSVAEAMHALSAALSVQPSSFSAVPSQPISARTRRDVPLAPAPPGTVPMGAAPPGTVPMGTAPMMGTPPMPPAAAATGPASVGTHAPTLLSPGTDRIAPAASRRKAVGFLVAAAAAVVLLVLGGLVVLARSHEEAAASAPDAAIACDGCASSAKTAGAGSAPTAPGTTGPSTASVPDKGLPRAAPTVTPPPPAPPPAPPPPPAKAKGKGHGKK